MSTTIIVPPEGKKPPTSGSDGLPLPGAVLLFAAVLAVIFVGNGFKFSDSSTATSISAQRPQPPRPRFAAFTTTNGDTGTPQAFVFQEGSVEIVPVRSEREIPRDDLEAARALQAAVAGDLSSVARGSVSVFHGDVGVDVGDIDGYDQWKATFQTRGGEIAAIKTELTTESPRGPPARRRIYVVGGIATFHGPDLHGHSQTATTIVDLSVTEERQRAYEHEVADFELEERRIQEQHEREVRERVHERAVEHPVRGMR